MAHQYITFDQELNDLKENILEMGVMVQAAIHNAIEAMIKRDRDLAKEVIKRDTEIDQLELEIDEKCVNLIALRQPKAGDLRFVTTGMRIATDLERIGDLAEDIAERELEIYNQPPLKPLVDIPKMGKLAEDSLAMALDAFVNRDPVKAGRIREMEKESDKLRDQIHDELLAIMSQDSSTVYRGIPLLLSSRHLERICDHIVNIAEDVIFMVDAKVTKHAGRKTRILFVCVENSCRSQMAEGLARQLGGEKIEVFSAGSKPAAEINPDAIKVMQEIGIDLSAGHPKGFNDLPFTDYDYLVKMGCGDACPIFPAKEIIDWQIDDPKGRDLDFFRKIRDEIKAKVQALIKAI